MDRIILAIFIPFFILNALFSKKKQPDGIDFRKVKSPSNFSEEESLWAFTQVERQRKQKEALVKHRQEGEIKRKLEHPDISVF